MITLTQLGLAAVFFASGYTVAGCISLFAGCVAVVMDVADFYGTSQRE